MSQIFAFAGFALLAAMVAVVLLRAVARARHTDAADGTERAMKVYRDQLAEVDRDLARGTLSASEAERLRLEVSRRILDLDRAQAVRHVGGPAPEKMRKLAMGTVGAAIVGSAALYAYIGVPGYPDMPLVERHADAAEIRANRDRQAALEAEFAAAFPDGFQFEGREELEPLVAQLRDAVARRPLDPDGLILLVQNETRLGNLRAAIEAQEQLIALRAEGREHLNDLEVLLDLMVNATGGIVSPEAESVIETILARDATNGPALYYTGRMYAQTGRPDMTFRVWRRLHDISAGDDPWMDEVRRTLPELARISGEPRFTLPPRPLPRHVAAPSQADIDAAADLSPEERVQMIEGMVDGLMARLANDGGTAEDWAQLLQALAVLERRDQALAILQEARTVFAARAEDLAVINETAARAGLRISGPDGDN